MKNLVTITAAAFVLAASVATHAIAAEPATATAEQNIKIGELLANPTAYEGKTIRATGIFAGECSDCKSFYFKDGMDTVETTITKGFPTSAKLGSKLEVVGKPALKTSGSGMPHVKLEAERITLQKE